MKPLVNIKYYHSNKPISRLTFSEDALKLINSKYIIVEKYTNEIIITKPSFDQDNYRHLRKQIDINFNEKIEGNFIIEQDGDEFVLMPTTETIQKPKITKKGKTVVNTQTNQLFKNVKELAAFLGCHYKTIVSKLNGNHKNNTPYKYL